MEQMANPIVIVGPNYIASSPVELVIVKKISPLSQGSFNIIDVNGNIIFKVKGKLMSFHGHRVLLDAAGNPILSFQQKLMTLHRRWIVFRGDSSDSKDKIFNVKMSSNFQIKTSLDVFLAYNKEENVCDFKVKGSWFDRSCTIYTEDGTTIIAQLHKKHTVKSVLLGKSTFNVTVYPNVDYAFIVALIVILHEINTPSSSSSTNAG